MEYNRIKEENRGWNRLGTAAMTALPVCPADGKRAKGAQRAASGAAATIFSEKGMLHPLEGRKEGKRPRRGKSYLY